MGVHDCVSKRKAVMLIKRAFEMGLNECSHKELEKLIKERVKGAKLNG